MNTKISFTEAKKKYTHPYIKEYLQQRKCDVDTNFLVNVSTFVKQYNKEIDEEKILAFVEDFDTTFDIKTPFTNPEVVEYIAEHKSKNILDEFTTGVPCIMLVDDKQIYTNPDFLNVLRTLWSRTKQDNSIEIVDRKEYEEYYINRFTKLEVINETLQKIYSDN